MASLSEPHLIEWFCLFVHFGAEDPWFYSCYVLLLFSFAIEGAEDLWFEYFSVI